MLCYFLLDSKVNRLCVCVCVCVFVCVQLLIHGPMDFRPPGSSAHRIFQTRILEWVAISSSRKSSQPRDLTCVPCVCCIGRWILYHQHQQGISYMYTYIPSFLDFLPQVITEHQLQFSVLYSSFSLAMYFMHIFNSAYITYLNLNIK